MGENDFYELLNEMDPLLKKLLHEDPLHFYTDEELDEIEAVDMELALRIARSQTLASKQKQHEEVPDGPIDLAEIQAALDEVRDILRRDGGDIEFVRLDGRIVRVRFQGACVGCPRSALDLKMVVERILKEKVPGVERVENDF